MLDETGRRLAPTHEAALRELLRATIGSAATLSDYEVVGRRPDYCVLLARAGAHNAGLVIKLAGPAAPLVQSFAQVARLHQIVAERTSIPVAEVLAHADTAGGWPWRYLIRRSIAGQEWATIRDTFDADAQYDAQRQIGSAVAELHAIEFDAWGSIGPDGAVADATYDPVVALERRAHAIVADPAARTLFLGALRSRSALFADVGAPALCHDDLHHFNILFRRDADGWRLATILDFDKSWAGLRESDLARMELWNMTGDGFWQTYNQLKVPPAGYPARRPLLQLLWCLEYGASTPQHHADTARVCAELGLAPIQFG